MAKIKIYLASQIFAECWRDYNEKLADRIEKEFPEIELYVPQRNKSINDKTKCATAEDIAYGDFTNNLDHDDIVVAVVAFGFNSAAYVAEIFRGGIMSIDNGQFEAGRSLGFNYVQTMIYIVIPQTIKATLPTLLNEIIALLKETSVAGYVGIMDLTKAGDLIRGRTFEAFMPLIAVAIIYLITVIVLTKVFSVIERRLRKSER
jgi:ABC-type amino acid transport system permease subunit